jgi:hypothetical protein
MKIAIYFVWMAFYSQFMLIDLFIRYLLDLETNGSVLNPIGTTVSFDTIGTVNVWELAFLGISVEFVCWLFFFKLQDNKTESTPLDSF